MNMKKRIKAFFTLKRRANDGFTLVELIVVIAILAILGGVAVPAYSGYVKKAERAADDTLLNAVNMAFASACSMAGSDMYLVTSAALDASIGTPINGLMAVKGNAVDEAAVKSGFDMFFTAENPDAQFKVIQPVFVERLGFVAMDEVAANTTFYVGYKGGVIEINSDKLDAFKNSNLAEAGVETLMKQTEAIVGWAGQELAGLAGEDFYSALATYLGLPADADEEAIIAKTEELAGESGSPDSIVANAMAIYAAQNATSITLDNVSGWMGQDYTQLQANANGETLGEAAAIYALYMSYKGESFDNTMPVLNVMDTAMSDSGFNDWLTSDATKAEAEAELNAFKGAMGIIYTATGDQDATNGLLLNGFGDDELIGIVQGVVGK